MLNSGSTRVWVLNASYSQLKKSQHAYVIENSTTASNPNISFWNVDGSFNATGQYISDVFHYGKAKIKGQYFGVINTIQEDDDEFLFPVDGVLGLTHLTGDSYKKGEPTAPIDSLTKPLSKKIVTYFLDKQVPPSKGASTGTVTIGGYDNKNCDTSIDTPYVLYLFDSLTTDGRYVAKLTGISYNTYTSPQGTYSGYFDTSISTVMMQSEDIKGIFDILNPSYDWDTGLYTVDCDSIDDMSYVVLNFDSGSIAISPEILVVDLDLDHNQCALALEIINEDLYSSENYVLGTPVFRSYCLTFDLDKNSVTVYPNNNF